MIKKGSYQKAEDNDLLNRYTLVEEETGRVIEIGIGPMMFGYRIRVGYQDDFYYYIDWCCGADRDLLFYTQGIVTGLLMRGYRMKDLPGHSAIKPWPKDPDFKAKLDALIDVKSKP